MEGLIRHFGITLREIGEVGSAIDSPRARLELRARALSAQLSEDLLDIAVEQLSALAKRDNRERTVGIDFRSPVIQRTLIHL